MVFNAPSRRIRVCAIRAVLMIAIAAVATRTTTANPVNPASPQVRSTNAVIRALMTEAAGHSRTFRRLLETIEGTDGIVYVESGVCGHGVRACLAMSVTPAGGYRILRILIDVRQKPRDLMASIGHELRHAIESPAAAPAPAPCAGRAPSAMRMPISRIRCVIEYAIRP